MLHTDWEKGKNQQEPADKDEKNAIPWPEIPGS